MVLQRCLRLAHLSSLISCLIIFPALVDAFLNPIQHRSSTLNFLADSGLKHFREPKSILREGPEVTENEAETEEETLTLVEADEADSETAELESELEDAVSEADETEKSSTQIVDEWMATEEDDEDQKAFDEMHMRMAIDLAELTGGERGRESPFPNPVGGAVLVAPDGRILGEGFSDYKMDCVRAVLADAGIEATPLKEWCVNWPSSPQLRKDIAAATLYITLEPSPIQYQYGQESLPPITQLIELSGIRRVVIGCAHPVGSYATQAASILHRADIAVSLGSVLREECKDLIPIYSQLVNSKLQRMARNHYRQFKRPLGFLHCSVVDSDDRDAFARHGNAFGKKFGGKRLSYREFGSYEIAPPPEVVWADEAEDSDGIQQDSDDDEDIDFDDDLFDSLDFEDEDFQSSIGKNPMMPWYEQVDAVAATFPRSGNGPDNDDSIMGRLNGLKWLATHGEDLPPGVERVLVMDATDLEDLPLSNDDPNLPPRVDIEQFWAAKGRKPTRVLLRRGKSVEAKATATAVAAAAQSAAEAAQAAKEAIETGDAILAAEAAVECQKAAMESTQKIQKQLEEYQGLKRELMDLGVVVETIEGGEPIDVMKHLGERNGYNTVVWRAGCWGERGVQSILAGAFQYVSAHLAVDAKGGRFWQLMLAENAVQAACGPMRKVQIFADDQDLSLEYCDEPDADSDCVLTVDGRPIRHVRLDCRLALIDDERPRQLIPAKTKNLDEKSLYEEAPWFL